MINVIYTDIVRRECVTLNEDDSYTVFINPGLSYEEQRKAYTHALRHIHGCHFHQDDVQSIEENAHEDREIEEWELPSEEDGWW